MDIQSGTFWYNRANPNSLGMQSIAWQDLDCKTREFQPKCEIESGTGTFDKREEQGGVVAGPKMVMNSRLKKGGDPGQRVNKNRKNASDKASKLL